MPCTLSPEEILWEEKRYNKEKFGLDMTDERVLTSVACAAFKALSKEQIRELPEWAQRWWKQHQKEDKKRKV